MTYCPKEDLTEENKGFWNLSSPGSYLYVCPEGTTGGTLKRTCNSYGRWENVSGVCSPIVCKNKDHLGGFSWPDAVAKEYSEIPCDQGYSGIRRRYCNLNGEFSDDYEDTCTNLYCQGDADGWEKTIAGSNSTLSCPKGYEGTMTRECNADGSWGQVDSSDCKIQCPSDNWNGIEWERSISGTYTKTCPGTATGILSRTCNNGRWEDIINECSCPSRDGFIATKLGEYSTKSCPERAVGNYKRLCKYDGTWGEIIDNCTYYCPADDIWGESIPGTYTKNCPTGYSGTMTRICTNSNWSEVNSNECKLFCPADDGFSSALSGVFSEKNCPSGIEKIKRQCINGTWGDVDSSECKIQCSKDGDWPETKAGETATIECTIGKKTRKCKTAGTWDKVNDECISILWIIIPIIFIIAIVIVIVVVFVNKSKTSEQSKKVKSN